MIGSAACLIAAVALNSFGDDFERAKALFDAGMKEAERGDYGNAIKEFSEAIRLAPDYREAFWRRGLAYDNRNEIDKAISDFTEVIRIFPNSADAFRLRGLEYYKKNDLARAISDITEALGLTRTTRMHIVTVAQYLPQRKNSTKQFWTLARRSVSIPNAVTITPIEVLPIQTIKILKKPSGTIPGQSHHPQCDTYYANRGIAYAGKLASDKAIDDFSVAIQLNPAAASNFIYRGDAYLVKSLYVEHKYVNCAISDYNAAIQLEPKLADYYVKRAFVYVGLGNLEKAIEDYTNPIQL